MFALVKNETVTDPVTQETSEQEVIKLFPPYTLFHDKDGVQYSAETLNEWSFEEKIAHGIYDVAYETRPDERFYTIVENAPVLDTELNIVKVTFTGTAKQLEDSDESQGLKSVIIDQIKQYSNQVLSKTDWMLIRKIERNIDVPADTATYRAAVLAESNRFSAAITAATTIGQVISAVNSANWPTAE
jgi:hypothetical protein